MMVEHQGARLRQPGTTRSLRQVILAAAVSAICFAASPVRAQTVGPAYTMPPSIEYGDLYRDVELASIFSDSKTFPDMIPDAPPATIRREYSVAKTAPGFDLLAFVQKHFTGPVPAGPTINPAMPDQHLLDYVTSLWPILQQEETSVPAYSTLQPLPYPYVVPGGRFREVYYWDSYFTMLGLEEDGQHQLAVDLLKNFALEIDRYGKVPNGNRSYYLSRSQPPFFSLMVDLIASVDGNGTLVTYLPELQQEWNFWMDGADALSPGQDYHNAVRLADGTLLNRYWDARDAPRDESYKEDVQTASASGRPARLVYRNLRATAESGWDFSSRWLEDGKSLGTVRTLSILPVDLNSLLVHLEQTLSEAYLLTGNDQQAAAYHRRAERRSDAIGYLMWDAQGGVFSDYLWRSGKLTGDITAATLYPLFLQVARVRPGARGRYDRAAKVAGCGRSGHHAGDQRAAMGRTQWVGSAAVDCSRRTPQLRLRPAGRTDRHALGAQEHRRLPAGRQAGREVQRDHDRWRRRWRWRVCHADRLWLDQRGSGGAHVALSGPQGRGGGGGPQSADCYYRSARELR